ncbi:hypothetical protein TNCV_1425831 [Trichonephila clavipes]|nr:hypothetical protein TNCV_1425831 [Trichonephila clavipes]
MATPGSSLTPTPLGHEDNLENLAANKSTAAQWLEITALEDYKRDTILFIKFSFYPTGRLELQDHKIKYKEALVIQDGFIGRGSLVVKVKESWPACQDFKLCTAEDTPCRGGRCALNISRLKRPPVGVMCNYQVIYSQFGLAIHQNDHQARRRFVEWAQIEIAVVPYFQKRILFSDEAHFWLNGYVNKQNCRIWSEANPQVYVETLLHPEKLTVWCALWAGGILLQKR